MLAGDHTRTSYKAGDLANEAVSYVCIGAASQEQPKGTLNTLPSPYPFQAWRTPA